MMARLGELVSKLGSGATPRGGAAVYLDSPGTTLIRSQNVLDNSMTRQGLAFITEEVAAAMASVAVEPGDVLMNITGESIARVAVVDPTFLPARVNQHVVIIRPKPGLDSGFLQRFLVSPPVKEHLVSLSSGATRKALTKAMLLQLEVPVRPLVEQQAIAEVLGALDDKIAANDAMITTIEALLRAHYAESLATAGATLRSIDEVFELNPRREPPAAAAPRIAMQDLPSPGLVIPKTPLAKPNGGVRFMNGDTLLSRITPCLENGKTGYVSQLGDGEVGFGSTEYIVMRSREGFPLPLSYFVATDDRFREQAILRMVGSSGRQRVKASDIAELRVPMTDDLDALSRFGELADSHVALAGSLSSEAHTLAELRDTLVPALMDGTIRVKDAVATAEEVL